MGEMAAPQLTANAAQEMVRTQQSTTHLEVLVHYNT